MLQDIALQKFRIFKTLKVIIVWRCCAGFIKLRVNKSNFFVLQVVFYTSLESKVNKRLKVIR
ncbi:hypothetical protein [Helicobacter sp. MIT 14-3879]|uniref:hypothetical protein n=1 Tax=Helicobacter sp. MIT 14-3879 TaxID=2040649 RepID=UPI0011C05FF3|nr:hypothetical protein [Helicobacter sp. MIT 14-3879]